MAKSRSFSIFLLKPGFDQSNSLKEGHELLDNIRASSIPPSGALYVLDNIPVPPWWRGYFGISQNLKQVTKGALLFLPVNGRCFALCFGHVYHNLDDTSYEYDFGLRVTLNCVDPNKLRSTEILNPADARRQRTQVPIESDLTFFEFDRDSTILKSLTGRVRDEYKSLFKNPSGASNFRMTTGIDPGEIPKLCQQLLKLYKSESYKTTFPNIQSVAPIRDPVLIGQLDELLLNAIRRRDEEVNLTIPEVVDYHSRPHSSFAGLGPAKFYDDVFMGKYYEYVDESGTSLSELQLAELKRHSLLLTDEEGAEQDRFNLYRCLIFDTILAGVGSFHLCDGSWYKVEPDYVARLESYLDPLWERSELPHFNHVDEGEYNNSCARELPLCVCLDETNISVPGESKIEPCDLYMVRDSRPVFCHVKRSTLSSMLSHLFNQGLNSMILLRSEQRSSVTLSNLITGRVAAENMNNFLAPLSAKREKVYFAIITRKSIEAKSENLPLFSRISLRRTLRTLTTMGIEASYGFVADSSPSSIGKKKQRRARAHGDAVPDISLEDLGL